MPNATHNPYLLLDDIAGWRCAFTGLTSSAAGLKLDALPGRAESFFPDSQSSLQCPAVLIAPSCRPLFLIDQTLNRILTMDPENGEIKPIGGVGGTGQDLRQFRTPRALAVLRDGSLAVADTGNRRIQVFSPHQQTLLAVIPCAPAGLAADGCDRLNIADSAGHCIVVFERDGTPVTTFGADQLQQPVAIALSAKTLAVIDKKTDSVVLFQDRKPIQTLKDIAQPRALAFSPDSNLYIGTANGLVFAWAPTDNGTYRQLGVGVLGMDGGITALAYSGSNLLAIVNPAGSNPRIWKINPSGAYGLQGTATSLTIDSGVENCQWHRLMLTGSTPPGTTIEVRSQSASQDDMDIWSVENQKPSVLSGDGLNPDCLFQCPPGRYLRFHLTYRSEGASTPSISGIRLYFPRSTYLQYLPAVYQEHPESRFFLERFLSMFQTIYDEYDTTIDNLWRMFDPNSVPEQYLLWLAAWLALPFDPEWPIEKKRRILKRAFHDYALRGTRTGLEQLIEDYAEVPGHIVEHYQLRTWLLTCCGVLDSGVRLWSRDFYQRLQLDSYSRLGYFRLTNSPEPAMESLAWGAHRFSVFFPVSRYDTGETAAKVIKIVESEKPAHTQATYCPVYPRFRVGVQSTIAIDTVVGDVNNLVLGSLATLGYDSILACSAVSRAPNQLNTSRAGITTTLS